MNRNIKRYLRNSLDNHRLRRWDKPVVNIYMTPVSFDIKGFSFEKAMNMFSKAVDIWNKACKGRIILKLINSRKDADVVVYWRRVGSTFAGWCNYDNVVNSRLKSVSLIIGLDNEFLDIKYDEEYVYKIILHELGHVLGLGHSEDENDIMSDKPLKTDFPTERDKSVLKIIYSLPVGMAEKDIFAILEEYISSSSHKQSSTNSKSDEDIISFLHIFGKYNLSLNRIRVGTPV